MLLIRTAIATLALASLATAQYLEISDLQAGQDAVAIVRDLDEGVPALFELRLIDEDGRSSSAMRRWRFAGEAGDALLRFDLPAFSAGRSLHLCVTSPSQRFGRVELQLSAQILSPAPRRLRSESDYFEGEALDGSWSLLNPNMMSLQVRGGSLHLVPTKSGASSAWVADNEGPFVYKTFTGDFDVTTLAHASSSAEADDPIGSRRGLGGLMVRDTSSDAGSRNSAHIVIGSEGHSFPIAVEDKTTRDSVSDGIFHSIPSMDLELRITRVGDLISRMYRLPGASSWILMRADHHPEFAQEVQVGLMAYSFEAPADIDASFEEILFH